MLLEVSDPVLLHRQRPVELYLTESALQGVELAHHFDQRVGGWFGHQGRDGACARGLRGATIPLCSVRARRVLQGPTLKASGQADIQLTARHLCLKRVAAAEPREAGTAAASPDGSILEVGTSFLLCSLGRALADLVAQWTHQADSQRRRPLRGGGGGG